MPARQPRRATGERVVLAMPDYTEGAKKDVAEIKFLIHDLRVERFINEVIHFHVTLNTDLAWIFAGRKDLTIWREGVRK